MYEAWVPNQAPKDGFTAFSGANTQDLRRSMIVLSSYEFFKVAEKRSYVVSKNDTSITRRVCRSSKKF